MNPLEGEAVLNLGEGGAFVSRATDPMILPQPYARPADYLAQYPTPLDTTEILAMCEEINLLSAIPEEGTSLNQHTWREMTTLAFVSGSSYVSFADGACPEEYTHNGSNVTVDLKNIGAKKTLSIRDIKNSIAIAAGNWHGINTLVGAMPSGEGLPGGGDMGSFQREVVAGVKEKEVRLAATLVMNGEDRLLVQGNTANNSLEYTGIENWSANYSCNFHTGTAAEATGTFVAANFDRFLSEGCAKPTAIFGNPAAIQEMMSAYFQLGFQGSQLVNFSNGDRIVPGFNFAGFVNTGIGRLAVVADNNFRKTLAAPQFAADLWALRMTHNGESLVYRKTQIPMSINDLAPGCTAVSFEVWKATALVIKGCCAQSKYTSLFTGRIVSTCTSIG